MSPVPQPSFLRGRGCWDEPLGLWGHSVAVGMVARAPGLQHLLYSSTVLKASSLNSSCVNTMA